MTTKQAQSAAATPRQVRATLGAGIAQLAAAGVPSAGLAAELLLLHILGRDRAWLYAHPEHELSAEEAANYGRLLDARAAGTPAQYLTGHQEFWGLEIEVTPAVLIPRPETEHLIEVALERLGPRRAQALSIADVGTGSGCIAIALAHELPQARIIATDISAAALEVARRNAARHSVASRIDFREADLLDSRITVAQACPESSRRVLPPQSGGEPEAVPLATDSTAIRSFDLIVSNPPYVARSDAPQLQREVRDHEPEIALFGGPTGVEIYPRLIDQAARRLRPGGFLVLELGYDSADHVRSLLAQPAWTGIAITNDLAGIPRVIAAIRTA